MVNLEQAKLLDSKVVKLIEYVERIASEKAVLQGKLESYQKRIDELEVLVKRFQDDQGRIEDSILSTLDHLSQLEGVIEKGLPEKLLRTAEKPVPPSSGEKPHLTGRAEPEQKADAVNGVPANGNETFFEIPEDSNDDEEGGGDPSAERSELDIF